MTIATIGAMTASIAVVCGYWLRIRRLLHLLQLEHYENARLYLWLRRRREFWIPREAVAELGLSLIALGLVLAGLPFLGTLSCAALVVVSAIGGRREARRRAIKPLVFTGRARRLFAATVFPACAAVLIGLIISGLVGGPMPMTAALVATVGIKQMAAPLLALMNSLLAPVQRRINEGFASSASARLAKVQPLVVGVTGSYGKTTTKVCIGAVLAEHEPTLITPGSFNSYLGVVRSINEHLADEHRAFVVEMGMYRAGDIAELCELVHPTIGVLTAIGPVHLERLGSIEAIADAKAELATALPPDGHLVVNGDDPRCVAIANRVPAATIRYALDDPNAEVRAQQIEMIDGRTHFDLVIAGSQVAVAAQLLGRHNVSNLLAAAAVGHVAGLPIESIKRGLEQVEPPPHRLQPITNTAGGIIVIDDAYNSNPDGAAAALEVLLRHPAKRRILVTPGMVELGDHEQAMNERFGRQAAAVCDHVILVGPRRTTPIAKGLRAGGFDPGAVVVVQDIAGATKVLARLTRAGDVVLFENDLPDMYSEDAVPPSGR